MIDLALARSTAEARFDATCTIRRDPQARLDDVLDDATGLLVRPNADDSVVYTGPCFVRFEHTLAGTEEGGGEATRPRLRVRVPVTTLVRPESDEVTIDSWGDEVPADSALASIAYRVSEVSGSSAAVTRLLICEASRGVPER